MLVYKFSLIGWLTIATWLIAGGFVAAVGQDDFEALGLIEDVSLLALPQPENNTTFASAAVQPISFRLPLSQTLANLTFMSGLEGSKQPQDYGVNATLGGRFEVNAAMPVYRPLGIGIQLGTATVASDNAVQVFELLGEPSDRYQQYVTVGAFQRTDGGLAWGLVYDFLYEGSFDTITLGQWRGRVSYRPGDTTEIGATTNLRSFGDEAAFGTSTVRFRTIDQASVYLRRFFETGVQGSLWLGVADEHGESNAVTGQASATGETLLAGADVLAPLSTHFAIYGETNLIFPADTGTVDAYMALVWYPSGNAKRARRTRFGALLPVAASTSFSVDLLP